MDCPRIELAPPIAAIGPCVGRWITGVGQRNELRSEARGRVHRLGAAGLLALVAASPAVAACPQQLAVYEGVDGIGSLEFAGGGAGMHPELRLLYEGVEPVKAYLSHDGTLDRTEVAIPLNCPEGDVTGAELAACLVYQGTVYTVSAEGVGQLPAAGTDAAAQVFLPNLKVALWQNPQFGDRGPAEPPAELFRLAGCQE